MRFKKFLVAAALAVGGLTFFAASPASADPVCGYGHVGVIPLPLSYCGPGSPGICDGPSGVSPYVEVFVCVNV